MMSTWLPRTQTGQSIMEVVLVMAIFGILAAALASLVVGGLRSLQQGGQQTEAEALAQEGMAAVRSIRDGAWNELLYDQSKVEVVGSQWVLSGEGTSETIGIFTRTISFSDVCRDGTDDIVACPGTYTDVHSKKVVVAVEWDTTTGATNAVEKTAYLTNWDSQDWTEDVTSDFTDGTFSSTENSVSLGDGDGAVTLQAQ